MASKVFLRKEFLEKRKALSEAEQDQLSFKLYNQFFAHVDLSLIEVLHIFLPIKGKGEPNTWLIIERLRREYPGIKLVLPRVNEAEQQLEHIFFEGLKQLKKNSWGIEEPLHGVPAEVSIIDLVVVPSIIFDQHGHRLGYGKGYYDKFLAHCRDDCQKIAISVFDPVKSIDDVSEWDIPMNAGLSPGKAYLF